MQCSSFAKYCLVKIWKISNIEFILILAKSPLTFKVLFAKSPMFIAGFYPEIDTFD